jgi:exodeoxyribonuclease VII large subunit
VPDAADLAAGLAHARRRLDSALERLAGSLAQRTDRAWLRLRALSPGARLERGAHRLALLHTRLDRALAAAMEQRRRRVREARLSLDTANPKRRLAERARRVEAAVRQLHACGARGLQRRQDRLQALARALHSLSPLGTLARGYAILRDEAQGTLVRSVHEATTGRRLRARVADGEFHVQVTDRGGGG